VVQRFALMLAALFTLAYGSVVLSIVRFPATLADGPQDAGSTRRSYLVRLDGDRHDRGLCSVDELLAETKAS
jgi:hypothetical protein